MKMILLIVAMGLFVAGLQGLRPRREVERN
jgi:hypothetical protein